MKGRTCFVIAHRLSTIRSADTIVLLGNGVVREVVVRTKNSWLIPDGGYRRNGRSPARARIASRKKPKLLR